MIDRLTDVEVRVLGALIEKALTTPDYYPLSLHALTTACNQASNRDPVVHYDEATVSRAIDVLRRRSLVRAIQRSDSRVMKYQHLVAETWDLEGREVALLGVLMLRGPQTVAELRTRSSRLAPFADAADVENALHALTEREGSPLVVRLERRPGQKEVRYAHLLSGEVTHDAPDVSPAPPHPEPDRIAALEEGVGELRHEVADLRAQLEAFRKQFE
ncbi:MAG: YceH family protein [Gemmatimonadaceae bacterium]